MRDVIIEATKGTGPGGQHRNTTNSCIVAKHAPTGLSARADMRSQNDSRNMAIKVLSARVAQHYAQQSANRMAAFRRDMVGSGERGDKVRTYRDRDNLVIDHRTGCKTRLDRWLSGDIQ